MTENVKQTALHHQSLRHVKNWMPLKIEAFVEATASVVDTNRTPKWQRLVLHPFQHWHQRSRQGWKMVHRPSYPPATHAVRAESIQSSRNTARFSPVKRKPLIPALCAH